MSKKAELIVEGRTLAVSNLDKVLYPKDGFTKGELINYYIQIAPVLLPHLKDRPLTMKRYPDGVEGEFFYEKNCPSHRPKWVQTAKVWSEGNQRKMHYCLAQDLPTLVWAANLADIELHTSLSRKKDVARPTMMVFDLDPGAPADIVQCCQVGLWLREILAEHETEKLGENFRLERPAGLRPAEHRGHLRPDEGVIACPRRTSRAANIPETWSFPKWRKRCAKEKSSSIGARTTSTRRRSASTRSARESKPTVSTPVTWEEVETTLKKKNGEALVFRCERNPRARRENGRSLRAGRRRSSKSCRRSGSCRVAQLPRPPVISLQPQDKLAAASPSVGRLEGWVTERP